MFRSVSQAMLVRSRVTVRLFPSISLPTKLSNESETKGQAVREGRNESRRKTSKSVLTIEPAVSYEATGHHWLLRGFRVSRVHQSDKRPAVGGGAGEPLPPQLVHVPGVQVAAMVLVVVPHAVIKVPRRADVLGQEEIDLAVAVNKIPAFQVGVEGYVGQVVFTCAE